MTALHQFRMAALLEGWSYLILLLLLAASSAMAQVQVDLRLEKAR